jgi:copper transport protein
LAGLALGLFALMASAHAELLQSSPPPGTVLDAAPRDVTLVFSEPVTPAGAGIKVFSPSGHQVAGPAAAAGPRLSSRLTASEAGTYVVTWQVFAADTHPSRGVFAFSVGHAGDNPYSGLLNAGTAGTATPLGLALQALARWVHFAGFALVFGVIAYGIAIRGAALPGRLVTAGVVLLIAAEPLALVAQLASLSFDGDTALAVLGSGFGRLLGLRLGAALLTWAVLATGRAWPVLGVGAVIALLDGAGAHEIPGLPGAGQALVAVHVGAMGLWVGGIAAFLASPDRRFASHAAWTLGAAVVTGLALALAHTHLGPALITSDYGRALVLKASILVAAVTAAALRRHRSELGLALLAVGAAALVAALPPPF